MIARFTFGVFFFFAIVSAVSCGLHSRPLGSLCNDDQCSDIYCGSRAQCSNEKFIGNGDCVCRCLPGAVVANGKCNGNGEKNCWDCVAGTYAGGPPAYCGREWSGRYQNPEKSQCIYCPSGTYSNGERNIACSKCPAGTRANQEIGATGCDSCSAGRYSSAGSVQCTYCPRGTYSGERSGECIKCPAGTISDIFSPSIDSCIPCPLGTYSTGSECIPCSVGWYADMTGSSECKKCPAGTIPDTGVSVGATGCLGCPPGTVNPNEGATQCTPCTAGFYSDLAGLTSCLTCPMNSYNNQPASDSCKLCPVGEYSLALSGSTSCNRCGSSVEVASPFTSGPRCCRRDASLLNNGTDGTDTPSTGPSSVWMAGDYPSVFGSNHHIYINLANNIPPLIYKNGASVITFAQSKYRSYIVSPNFRYFVIFQEDGNICKYAGSGPSCTTGGLWCSYPTLVPPALGPNVRWIHHMQPDGNLCTYRINDDGTNTKAWCMDGVLAAGSYMEIQDDGRFCRKSASGIRLECV